MIAKEPKPAAALPTGLADVALVDAETSAATGGMSVSWWLEEVRQGRAPAPAVRQSRCTRWRMAEVRKFWIEFARAGSDAYKSQALIETATKASASARAKRVALAQASV